MKKRKFLKTLAVLGLVAGASIGLAGCKDKDSGKHKEAELRSNYETAVSNGYEGSFEEWQAIISQGYKLYTVTYDYGVATDLFDNVLTKKTIVSNERLTDLPTITANYKNSFLGWFVEGTDTQIKELDHLDGSVTLEARFKVDNSSLSGLYQKGKYVKTWEMLKTEYPNAFYDNSITLFSTSGEIVLDRTISALYATDYSLGLTSVIIPNTVTEISGLNISTLTNIQVDENNPNYRSIDGNLYNKDATTLIQYALGKTQTLFLIPDSVTHIGRAAFSNCKNLTNVTIPNSVTRIESYAFSDCESLTSVTIPDSVINIENKAFYDCESLKNIQVNGNKYYKSIDGSLYTKSGAELIQYAIGKNQTHFNIPNSVTRIRIAAFSNCKNLTSVNIPDSVTHIESNAFSDCKNLRTVVVSNSINSIDDFVFYNCSNFNIFFKGTSSEWTLITSEEFRLDRAVIRFYSEVKPSENVDNYWHYDTDGVTPVVWNW